MILKPTLIALCGLSLAFLTDEEVDVVLSSMKHLTIRNCIFSLESDSNVAYIKKLNLNYIITGYVTPDMLEDYLTEINVPDAPTAIVMKNQINVKKLFLKKYEILHWLVWFLVTDGDPNDVDIPFNCQFFQIKKADDGNYRVVEWYRLKEVFVGEDFGIWSPEKGLNASSLNLYDRRKDLRGIKLKVEVCRKYKISMAILEFLEDTGRVHNFTIERDLTLANKDIIPGNYSGQPTDISTCIWAITGLEKEKDWVFLHFGIKVGVLTKFRGTNEIGWGAYVTPFAKDMWMAIFLWLIISTLAIIIVRGCRKFTVYINILTAFFCLCNNDPMVTHPPSEPLSFSTKLVYLMVLTVPSIIIPAYSGYILSTLSCVLPLTPFVDLKTFIADGSFTLTAPYNTFGLRFVKLSEDPDLKFIYKNSFKRLSRSYDEMFQEICKNSHLAGLFPVSKALNKIFQCKMYIMPSRVTSISTGILLPKTSPFRKLFNKRFRQHSEKGLKYDEMRSPIFLTNEFEEETENLSSLNMSQMKAIFLLVLFGIVLALFILIIEMVIWKRSQRNRKFRLKSLRWKSRV